MKDESVDKGDWIATVTTVSINTPKGIMKLPAEEMVDTLIRENPEGSVGSIIKYLQFYINRSGKKIDPEIKEETERAKKIFQGIHTKKKILS